MRTKILAILFAVLTAIGGLSLFKNIKDRITPTASATETSERIRIEVDMDQYDDFDIDIDIDIDAIVKRATAHLDHSMFDGDDEHDSDSDSDVVIDETFAVSDGERLFIDVSHADVLIETGAGSEARIRVILSGTNMARARDVFHEMEYSVYKSGDELRVVSENKDRSWNNRDGNISIEIVAFIPENFNLKLTSTHGDIEIENIVGDVYVGTTHGDIEAMDIRGNTITLKSTHGDIEAALLEAGEINIKTTHADIEIETVLSDYFTASTSHSDVEIGSLSGKSKISTSHGDIEVYMTDSRGAEFQTTHGDIDVTAPSGMKANLDIQGQSVRLDKGFSFDGRIEDEKIRGEVNGGGVKFKARTTHGSISVRSN